VGDSGQVAISWIQDGVWASLVLSVLIHPAAAFRSHRRLAVGLLTVSDGRLRNLNKKSPWVMSPGTMPRQGILRPLKTTMEGNASARYRARGSIQDDEIADNHLGDPDLFAFSVLIVAILQPAFHVDLSALSSEPER